MMVQLPETDQRVVDEIRSVRCGDDDHVIQLFEFDQVRNCVTSRSSPSESPPSRPHSAAITSISSKNTPVARSRALSRTPREHRSLTLRRTCSDIPALSIEMKFDWTSLAITFASNILPVSVACRARCLLPDVTSYVRTGRCQLLRVGRPASDTLAVFGVRVSHRYAMDFPSKDVQTQIEERTAHYPTLHVEIVLIDTETKILPI